MFKNTPPLLHKCQEASSFAPPLVVRRCHPGGLSLRCSSAEIRRARLPATRFSPLMVKIKRSRMLNIHHGSGSFAQKHSVFSTYLAAFFKTK